MDPAGAAVLQRRIEQHRQWQSARAVRKGDQPASDPDVSLLREIRDGLRIYANDGVTFAKRLVDGVWSLEHDWSG